VASIQTSTHFEPPVSIFYAKPSTTFDGKFMEPLEALTTLQNDNELLVFPPPHQPDFSVKPGFVVQDCIIKTQVYLIEKPGSEYHKQVFLYTGLIFPFIQFHSFMRKVTNQSFVKILLIKADRISSYLAPSLVACKSGKQQAIIPEFFHQSISMGLQRKLHNII
jgi:hypothetical protein